MVAAREIVAELLHAVKLSVLMVLVKILALQVHRKRVVVERRCVAGMGIARSEALVHARALRLTFRLFFPMLVQFSNLTNVRTDSVRTHPPSVPFYHKLPFLAIPKSLLDVLMELVLTRPSSAP